MAGRIPGTRRTRWGIAAYVRVGGRTGRQYQKTFARGTPRYVIDEWRAAVARQHDTQPDQGRLAEAIDCYLASLGPEKSRRRISTVNGTTPIAARLYLAQWRAAVGPKARLSLTYEDCRDFIAKMRAEGYSASSLNKLRVYLMNVWRTPINRTLPTCSKPPFPNRASSPMPTAPFTATSLGNQLLAWQQCQARGLRPGPLATFQGWKEKGRHVRRGEKALTLCRPVTVKRKTAAEDETEEGRPVTWFVYKPLWFVLAQTDGADLPSAPVPEWNREKALATLNVAEVDFDRVDGNCLGFARDRTIAASPVNPLPHKTRFHELAHVRSSAIPPKANKATVR